MLQELLANYRVRRALLVGALLGLAFLGIQAWLWLTNPVLNITTDVTGGRTVVFDIARNKVARETDSVSFKIRVTPGLYQVRRVGEDGGAQAMIDAKRGQDPSINLAKGATKEAEYLTDHTATSLFANGSQLRWLDQQTRDIRVLSEGRVSPRKAGGELSETVVGVEWAHSGLALAQMAGGRVYSLSGPADGFTSELDEDRDISEEDAVRATGLAPDGLKFFGLNGPNLVEFSLRSRRVKTVADGLDERFNRVVAGSSHQFIFAAGEFGEAAREEGVSALLVGNGQRDIEGTFSQARFSTGDRFLAAERTEGLGVYSLGDLSWSWLTSDPVYGMAWVGDEQFFYSDGAGLWSYRPGEAGSRLVLGAGDTLSALFYEPAGESLYYSLRSSENTARNGLYRLRLGGSTPYAALSRQLNEALPHTTGHYAIDLAGFADRPAVVITTLAVLNNDSQLRRYNRDTLAYRKEALKYLADQGIDVTKLDITFEP